MSLDAVANPVLLGAIEEPTAGHYKSSKKTLWETESFIFKLKHWNHPVWLQMWLHKTFVPLV